MGARSLRSKGAERMWSRSLVLRAAGAIFAGLIAVAAAGLLLAWSGLYSVAASRGHWPIVEWFLAYGMRRSVETHTIGLVAPALDDEDLVRLGAAHFHSGCAYCHGAPGTPISPVARQMLPSPPELSQAVKNWSATELFWIVKHGIKYTGMPGWTALERDDEVWAVVAFLTRLPTLDATNYRELALGPVRVPDQSGEQIATAQAVNDAVLACARCHGAGSTGPMSRWVPMLHGQPAEYLARALRAYAAGQRPSGIMQPAAVALDPPDIPKVAAYYAGLRPPRNTRGTQTHADRLEAGRMLASTGMAHVGIPACVTCHAEDALPAYPRLAGQSADYMIKQLRLWKRNVNVDADLAAIMAPIAQRLDDQQIEDVAAYFASLRRGGEEREQPQ
jgi:cytochrome c553